MRKTFKARRCPSSDEKGELESAGRAQRARPAASDRATPNFSLLAWLHGGAFPVLPLVLAQHLEPALAPGVDSLRIQRESASGRAPQIESPPECIWWWQEQTPDAPRSSLEPT